MLRRCLLACATRGAFSRGARLFALPPNAAARRALSQAPSDGPPDNTAVSEASEELARVKDSYLLLLADMENLRERTRREVASAGQFATSRFAKDILSVVDVLEMAASQKTDTTAEVIADGIRMTLDEARKVLERHGVAEIPAMGARFDPNVHEAVYEVPASGDAAGLVVAVAKKGYTLHGRVLRPAQVGVSK